MKVFRVSTAILLAVFLLAICFLCLPLKKEEKRVGSKINLVVLYTPELLKNYGVEAIYEKASEQIKTFNIANEEANIDFRLQLVAVDKLPENLNEQLPPDDLLWEVILQNSSILQKYNADIIAVFAGYKVGICGSTYLTIFPVFWENPFKCNNFSMAHEVGHVLGMSHNNDFLYDANLGWFASIMNEGMAIANIRWSLVGLTPLKNKFELELTSLFPFSSNLKLKKEEDQNLKNFKFLGNFFATH